MAWTNAKSPAFTPGPMTNTIIALVLAAVTAMPMTANAQASRPHVVGAGRVSVIVLHGGPGLTHRYLRPEWDRLAGQARLLFYDQRGCGQGERIDRVTWEELVAEVDGLVEQERVRGPVVLAGSSWGSILALLYAYRHPGAVEGLILTGVPDLGFFQSPARPGLDRESDPVMTRAPAVQDSATVAGFSGIPPTLAERIGMACPRTTRSIVLSMSTAPRPADLAGLALPILLVRGADSTRVGDGAPELAAIIPSATLLTLPGGHDPWFDSPELFFGAAQHFVAGIESERDGVRLD